jgi:Cysteine-rich CWC
MNTSLIANLRPLCGKNNQCAMEIERTTGVKQAPCWCAAIKFDEDLLARVPEEKRNLACICEKCAQLTKTSSDLYGLIDEIPYGKAIARQLNSIHYFY